MKIGDIVICKRGIVKNIFNEVIIFRVGDRCTIVSCQYISDVILTREGKNDIIPFMEEKFYDHFETVADHRKRVIENL